MNGAETTESFMAESLGEKKIIENAENDSAVNDSVISLLKATFTGRQMLLSEVKVELVNANCLTWWRDRTETIGINGVSHANTCKFI